MTRWDADDVALLGRVASDLTALAATIEVLRRRSPAGAELERAERLVQRLHVTVSSLVERLRE